VTETPAVFEHLVSKGADVTLVNNRGETVFDRAVDDENEQLMEFLMKIGAARQTLTAEERKKKKVSPAVVLGNRVCRTDLLS
jgi:hypothetical protein